MKNFVFSVVVLTLLSSYCNAKSQDKSNNSTTVEQEISALQQKQKTLERNVLNLTRQSESVSTEIEGLQADNDSLQQRVDSLETVCKDLSTIQKADKDTLSTQIDKNKVDVEANVSERTAWGIGIAVVLLCALAAIAWWFVRKFKRGTSSLDEVRRAQDVLEKAQTKMQEESIKLDNKLIELAEQQLATQQASASTKQGNGEKDHSLTLKVADELVRIEMNLSRMDSSVKGHKQLSKAVQRIKDNFSANGYEIVDMLGKPYNEGMKVTANFVPDESLEEGQQIITGIIKPQINYRGVMIQSAQITVSQNI